MATITASAYNDAAARTAGEAMTINNGAEWTVRTDYRVHANAPASNLGALGSVTINEGKLIWDSTATRWLPFNSGTGNVPAIGTTISQGAVSGYLLGVWVSTATAQTAVGAAMPATGFVKFREVTGGAFAAGALTGIGASATGADVQGWLSFPHDANAAFTIPRLGEHRARGGRFFLENTTGVRGQTFQVPVDGSTAALAPGAFVETGVGTDQYEFWAGLAGAANGWSYVHIGNATGTTDVRQQYLSAEAGGILRMGSTWSVSATYASLAAQASTYTQVSQSCVYTHISGVVEVYIAAGHFLETGQQTGLQFTSGGLNGTSGIYAVTVVDASRFTVAIAGSSAGGAVTSRPGITITFAAHTVNINDSVYCDFTSGTGVDGTYAVYMVGSTSAYTIKYPSTAAVTSGNVSCLHSLVLTYNAHGLSRGQSVYCDFTTGAGVDGAYFASTVATNTITIKQAHTAATSGNVTISMDIGHVVGAGRRVWIPSNILHEVATAARQTNTAPSATIGNRPEWVVTAAGAIDLEYVYATSAYFNCVQPYSMRLRNCVFFDTTIIEEVATPIDIDGLYMGSLTTPSSDCVRFRYNYAGGLVKNVSANRGNAPSSSNLPFYTMSNFGLTFENIECATVQYARLGPNFLIMSSLDCVAKNIKSTNCNISITQSLNITVDGVDHCERLSGHGLAALNTVSVTGGCINVLVSGVVFGRGNTIAGQAGLSCMQAQSSQKITVRLCGSIATPIPLPAWAPNVTALGRFFVSGGANKGIRVQQCFANGITTALFGGNNSDTDVLYETCDGGLYALAYKSQLATVYPELDCTVKGCSGVNGTTGQSSTYGTHFSDHFSGPKYGKYWLNCNESSPLTTAQFTNVVGTAKFNASGGVIVQNVNDQCYFTDTVFRLGHTGFVKGEVVMSGGTATSHDLHYQIDLGPGWSEWKNLYYRRSGGSGTSGQSTFTVTDATGVAVGDYCFGTGLSTVGLGCEGAVIPKVTQINGNTITVDVANTGTVSGVIRFTQLPNEVVDPAVGFKMRWRITTIATATNAITFLRVDATSTTTAQANFYPLDTNTLSLTGLPTGCDLVVLSAGTSTILHQLDAWSSSTLTYTYSGAHTVDVGIIKPGYVPFYIRNLVLSTTDSSIPVSLTIDRNYQT